MYRPCQKAYTGFQGERQQGKLETAHLILPKPAHLITLPGHLSFHASDLFLALIDLHGEPGGHALSCNLQVPLPLKLILKVVDPLLTIGALLVS